MSSTKILGALLLIAGLIPLVFGVSYISSPQYEVMNVVNGMMGARSDMTGHIAMGIGGLLTLIGLCFLFAKDKNQIKGERNEKKRVFSIVMIATLLSLAFPIAALADSRSFTPPPQKGTVYVIVRHKKAFPPMKTKISINWGSWSKSGPFDAAGFRYSREGFIIRLDHKTNDSIPLTVTTDGYIVDIYQGPRRLSRGIHCGSRSFGSNGRDIGAGH